MLSSTTVQPRLNDNRGCLWLIGYGYWYGRAIAFFLRATHVHYSFCSTLSRAHIERWTSNGLGNNERWTWDVKGKKGKVTRNWKERTKPICEQNRNRDWTKQDTSLNRTRDEFGQNRKRNWTKQDTSLGRTGSFWDEERQDNLSAPHVMA